MILCSRLCCCILLKINTFYVLFTLYGAVFLCNVFLYQFVPFFSLLEISLYSNFIYMYAYKFKTEQSIECNIQRSSLHNRQQHREPVASA